MTKQLIVFIRSITLVLLLLVASVKLWAQPKADKSSSAPVTDTATILRYLKESKALSQLDPQQALLLASKALNASEKISYKTGKQLALAGVANRYISIGNYVKALEYNLELLAIIENGKDKNAIVKVLTNIGAVYAVQEQYSSALQYYYRADSIISRYDIPENNKNNMNIALNIGDAYDKMQNTDSAFIYFNRCLAIAQSDNDELYMGAALVGLGHTYRKMEALPASKNSYLRGLFFLEKVKYNELVCEATLGLSTLYKNLGQRDSAIFYAKYANDRAIANEFLPWQMSASKALAALYGSVKNSDSSLYYLKQSVVINDSINSREKILSLQGMTTSENIRQVEMAERRAREKKERKQSLQLMFIGIFIPGFFAAVLLMSKVHLPIKVVRWLGILSLIILVEFITLLMHPFVAELTHHTPILEMLIFVSIALFIIPGHHRLEKWLVKWLMHNKPAEQDDKLNITTKSIDITTRS